MHPGTLTLQGVNNIGGYLQGVKSYFVVLSKKNGSVALNISMLTYNLVPHQNIGIPYVFNNQLLCMDPMVSKRVLVVTPALYQGLSRRLHTSSREIIL